MSAEVKTFTGARVERPGIDLARQTLSSGDDSLGHSILVLPAIRRAGPLIKVPSVAEQAAAVAELHALMRDHILPGLPLLELGDGATFLDRLQCAAATLRQLSEGGAA